MLKFIKAHYIIATIVGLAVVGGVSYSAVKSRNGTEYATATRTTLVKTVAASGKTKSTQDVSLGFDRGGKVKKVHVKVGDVVKAGQVLVELDQSEEYANFLKAKAVLAGDSAKSTDLGVGLGDARSNLIVNMRSAFNKSDDAVRNYADQFFNSVSGVPAWKNSFADGNLIIYLNVPTDLKNIIVAGRTEIQNILPVWSSLMSKLSTDDSILEKQLAEEKVYLAKVSQFFENLSLGVNQMVSPSYTYDATFAGFRSDVATARSNVQTSIKDLTAAEEKYNAARQEAGNSSGQDNLAVQQAKILQSQADVAAAEAQLAKMTLRAPFDGIVTKVEVDPGEIVTAGSIAMGLISNAQFEIESNVSEVNIGKVNPGNPVSITFDAFPGERFEGSVAYVEPAETIVDNVVNYKVRITLNSIDNRIKSGLTANLTFETSKKENALVLPNYALITQKNDTFVLLVTSNGTIQTPVTKGDSGDGGLVEIISGLSEGDRVEIPE